MTAPTGSASAARPVGRIGLAAGVELAGPFVGSGYRDVPRLVYRADGQVIRLPELLYAVVRAISELTVTDDPHPRHAVTPSLRNGSAAATRTSSDAIAAAVTSAIGRDISGAQIAYLCDRKLAPLGITTDASGAALPTPKAEPFLALRFRTAALPASVTWHIAGAFQWLYLAPIMVVALVAAVAAQVWALGTHPLGTELARALASPTGIVAVVALALASTAFHEAGHASACRFGGVAPGVMGCGIYLVWPAFYTDITATYRLGKAGRLRADLGGVYFNTIFTVLLTAGYAATGYAPLLAAILITDLEIVEQLLPTLRFDGYYIVADLVGIPDLFTYVRPIVVRTFHRHADDPRLRELKRWPQVVVTAWVFCMVPTLILELGYLAVQLPSLIRADADSVRAELAAVAASHYSVSVVALACLRMVLVALPVAGVVVILGGIARALLRALAQRFAPAMTPQVRRIAWAGALAFTLLVWFATPIGDGPHVETALPAGAAPAPPAVEPSGPGGTSGPGGATVVPAVPESGPAGTSPSPGPAITAQPPSPVPVPGAGTVTAAPLPTGSAAPPTIAPTGSAPSDDLPRTSPAGPSPTGAPPAPTPSGPVSTTAPSTPAAPPVTTAALPVTTAAGPPRITSYPDSTPSTAASPTATAEANSGSGVSAPLVPSVIGGVLGVIPSLPGLLSIGGLTASISLP